MISGISSQSQQKERCNDRKEKISAAILLFSLSVGCIKVWRGSQCIGQFMLIYLNLTIDLL